MQMMYLDRSMDRAIESLAQYVNGQPLSWAIDLDQGY